MAEDVLFEIRHILQDILAPDFKTPTTKVSGIQKQLELSGRSMSAQLDAFRAEMRSEFQAQRNPLQNEVLQETSSIRERLASLEAHGSR